jgi:hypothetical protein
MQPAAATSFAKSPLCGPDTYLILCGQRTLRRLSAGADERAYRVSWFGELTLSTSSLELRVANDGHGRLSAGRESVWLSQHDVITFETALAAAGFGSMPPRDREEMMTCVDGTELDVEAVVDRKYHGVSRNCRAQALWPAVEVMINLAKAKHLGEHTTP